MSNKKIDTTQIKLNFILGVILGVFTIIKYATDEYWKIKSNNIAYQLLSPLFYATYCYAVYYAIIHNNAPHFKQDKITTNWFVGLKTIAVIVLVNVVISSLIEMSFPSIKSNFIALIERDILSAQNKNINAKDIAGMKASLLQYKENYLPLKLSSALFILSFLGIFFNTIICLALKIYYSRLLKNKTR